MHVSFSHTGPGRIHAGPGALEVLAGDLPPGVTLLVVADAGLVRAGVTDRVLTTLADREAVLFGEITPDPAIAVVEAAHALYREAGAGAILAVGGGSALDAAKGLAALAGGGGTLREYGDGREVTGPLPPLYALPTTAGTGSEATRVAVITDPAGPEKMAIRGEPLLPRAAALDPDLLATLPAPLAAETGADALTHAVEAYVSRRATPFTDALALAAVAGVGRHLRALVADRGDGEAALGMLVAANQAGQAFTNAGLGLAHSLGEPLGAWYHVSHGLGCALYLPAVMAFNRPVAPERFARLGRALAGAEGADDPVGAVRTLLADVGLPATFAEVGIEFELRPGMVEAVWPQQSTACNPRQPNAAEVEALYRAPATAR